MSRVKLQVRDENGTPLLIFEGELVSGDADKRLESEFHRLIGQGCKQVVIDLSQVTYIDSSVLGKLVYGHSLLRSKGGRLRLVNPPRRVMDLLKVTRLISVFEIFGSREQALGGRDAG